jgi:hypothetical protein
MGINLRCKLQQKDEQCGSRVVFPFFGLFASCVWCVEKRARMAVYGARWTGPTTRRENSTRDKDAHPRSSIAKARCCLLSCWCSCFWFGENDGGYVEMPAPNGMVAINPKTQYVCRRRHPTLRSERGEWCGKAMRAAKAGCECFLAACVRAAVCCPLTRVAGAKGGHFLQETASLEQ